MLRRLFDKKGQNTAEYAIVIGLVIAAAIAMQTYVKRGLQGHVKDGTDYIQTKVQAEDADLGKTGQYEPYYLESSFDVAKESQQLEKLSTGGKVRKEIGETEADAGETTTRAADGYQKMKSYEDWENEQVQP
ncbi:MAG: hypothetical protein AB1472_00515 [Candidatus Omnitrophota bacterium]